MGSALGPVGTVAGSVVGGPVGGMIGGALGSTIGGAISGGGSSGGTTGSTGAGASAIPGGTSSSIPTAAQGTTGQSGLEQLANSLAAGTPSNWATPGAGLGSTNSLGSLLAGIQAGQGGGAQQPVVQAPSQPAQPTGDTTQQTTTEQQQPSIDDLIQQLNLPQLLGLGGGNG